LTGQSTVPNVFIAKKSIGGGDDTAALGRSGELDKLLAAAKALQDA
jgi:glutaredoxin